MASEETEGPREDNHDKIQARVSLSKDAAISRSKTKTSSGMKLPDESKASGEAKFSMEAKASVEKQKMANRQSIDVKPVAKASKDVISLSGERPSQESKKSIMSLGPAGSKDVSKDIFYRRKSSRSIGRAVGSIVSFRRGSIAEYFDRQKTAKFMNTYKLDSDKPFNVDKVEKILKEVLIEALDNLTYDADKVPKQAKWASNLIRSKIKEQEYDRYKLICNVTIGEKRSQDMYSTYRFLWDAERDKHASCIHENMYVFAIAVCFGIYYE